MDPASLSPEMATAARKDTKSFAQTDFIEMAIGSGSGSASDLKSVPSDGDSPVQSAASSESLHPRVESPRFPLGTWSQQQQPVVMWLKYKRYRDPATRTEVVYERMDHHLDRSDSIYSLCDQLLTWSSISLFVASNLLAFTVGLIIGRRGSGDF